MTELEQLIEQSNQLALEELSIAKQKSDLASRIAELKTRIPILIEINLVSTIVQFKVAKYDPDITQIFQSIPMRQYDSISQLNSIPAKYFLDALAKLELLNIEFKWKVSKEEILAFVNQLDYTVSVNDNAFQIIIKLGVNTYNLTNADSIPQARLVKKSTFKLGFQESSRLSEFLTKVEHSVTPEALAVIDEYLANENKFKEVKSLAIVPEHSNILKLELKDFQTVGVEFAHLAKKCIIGDEMGLGKSPMAIAVSILENDRTLFVVPSQLVLNWYRQITKFTNEVPHVLTGTKPNDMDYMDLLAVDRKTKFTIIGMGSLSRPLDDDTGKFSEWANLITMSKFDRIVVDEAHYIKTEDSNRSWVIRQLASEKLTLLTGTPVMNRPKELWPLLNMIDSETFSNSSSFEYAYSDGNNGVRNVKELRNILDPLMIRRLKSEVQTELDPINQIVEYVELSPKAKKIYNKALLGIYEHMITGNSQAITHILALFTRLQQICTIAKYDHVVDLAKRIIESKEGEQYDKVLIGTQYVQSAYQLASKLDGLIITGEMSMEDRMKVADNFQTNLKHKYLVASTKSVQEGLDLTAAGSVINVDLMWTPAAHQQFEGRAFGRLNDSHSIDSYYILGNKTVEEMKWGLLKEKLNTIDQSVNNKDMTSDNTSIFRELVRRMKETGFSPLT